MPCNCILDKPLYPRNEEWGPHLWRILHVLAEKAGRQTNSITRGDEQLAWPSFFKELGSIIPCPYCKDHFQDYVKQHPFDLPADYFEWKEYIPLYFYNLHESVNQRLGKPSFSFQSLKTTYNDSNTIKNTLVTLDTIVMKAIKMGGVSLFSWRAWIKQLNMLRAAIL